jgi:hypothetical protein
MGGAYAILALPQSSKRDLPVVLFAGDKEEADSLLQEPA